jgi:hypothetical protein
VTTNATARPALTSEERFRLWLGGKLGAFEAARYDEYCSLDANVQDAFARAMRGGDDAEARADFVARNIASVVQLRAKYAELVAGFGTWDAQRAGGAT